MRPFAGRWGFSLLLALFAIVAISGIVSAQEAAGSEASPSAGADIEGIFADSSPDATEAPSATSSATPDIKQDKLRITGSYSGIAVASLGWASWPDFTNLAIGFSPQFGFVGKTTLNIDARPDPSLKIFMSLSATIGGTGVVISPVLSVGELYCCYYLGDAFFQLGRFTATWGQGRLFSPGNLVASSQKGLSFQVAFPTVLSGLTFMAITPEQFVTVDKYSELGFAGALDGIIGPVLITGAAYFQGTSGWKALLSTKTTIVDVDLFAEGLYRYDYLNHSFQALAGFYWQAKDSSVKAYGEYFYNGELGSAQSGHSIALYLGFAKLFGGPLDLGLAWYNSFNDGSGTITIGLQWNSPAPFITIKFGIPIAYGPDGTYYVSHNPAISDQYSGVPINRLGLALSIGLNGSF